ncbi:DUF3604 domain-containing protein [Porticoccaceae bacterium]|nr:DUF3604 domain-containing protein [Porticoccaceae bacterium]
MKKYFLLCIFFSSAVEVFCSEDNKRVYPETVYWGDTHLHTNLSLDANGFGNKNLTPDDAYRFAKGETISSSTGRPVRLERPLDFLVVADHSENIGVMSYLEIGDSRLLETEVGKIWHQKIQDNPIDLRALLAPGSKDSFIKAKNSVEGSGKASFFWSGFGAKGDKADWLPMEFSGYIGNKDFRRSVWREVIKNAERNNSPGVFSAFIGYEWSSPGKSSTSLHRVVIYKDGIEKVGSVLPFTAIDSYNPEALWAYMAEYEEKTKGEVIAIPHNGNFSSGSMFSLTNWEGEALDFSYSKRRSRWEPLYEVTQIKGDSEAHPILSPMDEFADFETWNSPRGPGYDGIKTEGWEKRKAFEYARSGLKIGLGEQAKYQVNPFKFGLIGSTDAHTSMAAVEENNFQGKFSLFEPSPYRMKFNWSYSAAGYAAVWAEENTRESLFAAMKRKEVYASTGPRITARFFGGWEYEQGDALRPDIASVGYRKGVPMGGDLTRAPEGGSPKFLIRVVKDPVGANLDRVQIIKGWRDKKGKLHEKIYNVALSDQRQPDSSGKVKPVGNTVNVKEASYTNTIGDPEFSVMWQDPDFDKNELAFYYVRALEIPTPRWTAYDAKYFQLKEIPEEVPMVVQERVYTSPIWFTP